MQKLLGIAVMALTLAGCETARQDRVLGGALIGWPMARLDRLRLILSEIRSPLFGSRR
jgi:hypothetical protein